MPLLPMGPPQQGGGIAAPPVQGGAPPGLMPPPPPDLTPAGSGAVALAQLAQQQEAQKAQWAQEAMAVALQAIGEIPNPAAMAAQTEPAPAMSPGVGAQDQMTQGGY